MLRLDASHFRATALSPPVSKSDAQRALVLAHLLGWPALAELPEGPLPDDIRALSRGLQAIARAPSEPVDIDCGDGGAPLRLLLGQAAVAPAGVYRLWGSRRLAERPHGPLIEALASALGPHGTVIRAGAPWPIEVRPSGVTGAPRFRIAGAESSQFVSSLLLAAAALERREQRAWTVELVGPTASAGYLELTLSWLQRAGFSIVRTANELTLSGWQRPEAPPRVPGDWSSAAYLLLVAWRCGGEVLGADLTAEHPDREVVPLLRGLGLTVEPGPSGGLTVRGAPRGGLSASARTCPDLIPTLAALACVLPAPSRFTEVEILRLKESDRLEGASALVRAAGGRARIDREGALEIQPPAQIVPQLRVDSRGDHRLAMAGATLAVLGGARAEISDPDCVAKSFPGFWEQLQRAGVALQPT